MDKNQLKAGMLRRQLKGVLRKDGEHLPTWVDVLGPIIIRFVWNTVLKLFTRR